MPSPRRLRFLAPLLVVLAALIAHAPAIGHEFVDWDDNLQVFDNAIVTGGLTWRGVREAFTNTSATLYWMPATYLSHMIDVELYGLEPWGHHLTNILLHAANAGLLWLLLRRLTGSTWRSAAAAALFATHPVHVESVAWVTERKDVLSLLFGLVSLLAYERFAREAATPRRVAWYAVTAAAFALGLMAKAMIVTLPCVMLLLDAWPLRRIDDPRRWRVALRLVVEKLPLLLIAAGASALTAKTQAPTMMGLGESPLAVRLANATVSYGRYLEMLVWPVEISTYYPYVPHWPAATVAAVAAVLAGMTAVAVLQWPRRPYLLVGWLWFLGTLVPMLGIVQVGEQSLAPRFVYLPAIGLYLALAWLVTDLATATLPRVRRRAALATLTAAAAAALTAGSWAHTRHWHDTEALFRQSLRVSPSAVAHVNLGAALIERGRTDEALHHFAAAEAAAPNTLRVRTNLAAHLIEMERFDEAMRHLTRAIELQPSDPLAHVLAGTALLQMGRLDDADAAFREALRLHPAMAEAKHGMGLLRARQGQTDEAAAFYREAIEAEPLNALYRGNYGLLLQRAGRLDEAIAVFEEAAHTAPHEPEAWLNLAIAQAQADRVEEAVRLYERALALRPRWPLAENNLGVALARLGRFADAVPHFERAAAQGHPGAAANAARAREMVRE